MTYDACADRALEAGWVPKWQAKCKQWRTTGVLTRQDAAILEFAIRWAPFGGASPTDLLTNFGVGYNRFLEIVTAVLTPAPAEAASIAETKRYLLATLVRTWRGQPRAR